MSAGDGVGEGTFDGVICIGGEDWWYHNRGHFDFQIMRRLAQDWPVLFVNSLGVRMPSLKDNKVFATRMARKLKSLAQGVVNVENRFWVFSPVSVPGAAGQMLSSWALGPQIRLAAAKCGIRRPLLWVHCPAGAVLIDDFADAPMVLQRTDRFESFPEGDPVLIGRQLAALKARADLVVYAAPHLMDEEAGSVSRQLLVTHGCDHAAFVAAGLAPAREPDDVARLPRPRVGFIGGIDAHTFSAELLLAVARAMPDAAFALVGGCSLPAGWCARDNVHLLGRKPYEEVAAYMAAMDVLVMPWNASAWIQACNPIKLKEYLAVGRPVVTTDFPALDAWRDLVRVATGSEEFVAAIRAALAEPYDASRARGRTAAESWDAKAALVRDELRAMGLRFAPRGRLVRPAA